MKRRLLYCFATTIVLFFISINCVAQIDTIYRYTDVIKDEIIDLNDTKSSVDYNDEINELRERLTQPININTASKEQLKQFPFLSDLQIENILAYIYIHGEMKSLYEMQLVEDMDWQTIRFLLPFICAKPIEKKNYSLSFNELFKNGRSEMYFRNDIPFYRSDGYKKGKYMGLPYYQSICYYYKFYDRVYAGVTAEKDAGEPFFSSYNKGYDAYSIYVLLHDIGRIKTLAIGDYKLSFGQGLVVSNNFLLGKSTYSATMNMRVNNIRKHSSVDEFNYFRGIATSYMLTKKLMLSAFLSYRKMDGTLKGDSLTAISESGLHRTSTELEHRKAFGLFFIGSNLNYESNNYHIGATGVYYKFSNTYYPVNRKYNKYALRGSEFYNYSTDYSYRIRKFSVIGETAFGKHGMATLNRLEYSFSGYKLMLFHRYYAHNYWAYFAHSFSEGSDVENENGWFLASDIAAFRKISLFAAIDLVSFPWYKYRISKPSQSTDVLFRITYLPSSKIRCVFNYRYRQKERDVTGSGGADTRITNQHFFRIKNEAEISSFLNIQTLAGYNLFQQKGIVCSRGYHITQGLSYVLPVLPMDIVIQGTYFNTDDYDSRVYVYERSLYNSFYIPSFQGVGLRFSFFARYRITKWCTLVLNYGQTCYYNQTSFGSGYDKVDGNVKRNLQLQVRMSF